MGRRHGHAMAQYRGRSIKPIEQVGLGDRVWAWCSDGQRAVPRPVSRLYRRQHQRVLAVVWRDAQGRRQHVTATLEHPFWVQGRGWVPACALQAGDRGLAHEEQVVVWVERLEEVVGAVEVFNLEVERAHNYFVGCPGVLVHNESSLDTGDGAPVGGRPVPPPTPVGPLPSPFVLMDTLGCPTTRQTLALASRLALGATFGLSLWHMAEKYGGVYEAQVQRTRVEQARAELLSIDPHAERYQLPAPALALSPEFMPAPMQLQRPSYLVEFDRHRLARDLALTASPMKLAHRAGFADEPARAVPGSGVLGLFQSYVPLRSAADVETAGAMVRQALRQGDWREARQIAYDADLMPLYHDSADEYYRPPARHPALLGLTALMQDGTFLTDVADVGGRAIAASSFGNAPMMAGPDGVGIAERWRFAGALLIHGTRGMVDSLGVARDGVAPWSGASSHADVWAPIMQTLAGRAISDFASEHAASLMPAGGMRYVQSGGRWTLKPDLWSNPTVRHIGMAATDTFLSVAMSNAAPWLAQEVAIGLSKRPATPFTPFGDGVLPGLLPSAAAFAGAYTLLHPGLTPRGGAPWEYTGLVVTGARYVADQTYGALMAP